MLFGIETQTQEEYLMAEKKSRKKFESRSLQNITKMY